MIRRLFTGRDITPRDILATLESARSLGAHFDLQLKEAPEPVTLRLGLAFAGPEGLVLELTGPGMLRKSWEGMEVAVRFALPKRHYVQPRYYGFETTILEIRRGEGDTRLLELAPVKSLGEIRQRRNVRIAPPQRHMPHVQAWPWKELMPPPRTLAPPVEPCLFRLDPVLPGEEVLLHNISAGGMRLSLSRHKSRGAAEHLRKGKTVLIRIIAPETPLPPKAHRFEPEKSRLFTLLARVTRQASGRQGRVDYGMHFIKAALKGGGHPGWQDIARDGLDELGRWVQHRLRELARIKPES